MTPEGDRHAFQGDDAGQPGNGRRRPALARSHEAQQILLLEPARAAPPDPARREEAGVGPAAQRRLARPQKPGGRARGELLIAPYALCDCYDKRWMAAVGEETISQSYLGSLSVAMRKDRSRARSGFSGCSRARVERW